jgi:L-fuconolactonase
VIIDAQMHAWRRGDGGEKDPSGDGVEAHDLLGVMDANGVGAAVVVSANSIYDLDSSFALETAANAPSRLRAVGPVLFDRDDPVGFVEEWAADSRTGGLRVVLRGSGNADGVLAARHRPTFDAIERLAIPLCIWAPGEVPLIGVLAERHPGMPIVIDHTGVSFTAPMTPERVAAEGAAITALSRYPQVLVKLTGIPALSAEAFPFRDAWQWAEELIAAFAPERVMWGTDWTRTRDRNSYTESLGWIREAGLVAGADLEAVMGLTADRVFFT